MRRGAQKAKVISSCTYIHSACGSPSCPTWPNTETAQVSKAALVFLIPLTAIVKDVIMASSLLLLRQSGASLQTPRQMRARVHVAVPVVAKFGGGRGKKKNAGTAPAAYAAL